MITKLLQNVLRSRVYDVARETPLDRAGKLSERIGHAVLLKREDLQPVFSFKLRGAYNRMAHLTDEQRALGVIAASAGNHAQGVAYAARELGIRAVIVMPDTTPDIKVAAVRGYGAEVVLSGESYSDAQIHCEGLIEQSGMTLIHPFDDPLVIAGQGTVGDEILRQSHGLLDAVFVPVGGGGLIAGIAGYMKTVAPDIKVIGVEPFEADAMYQSLQAGRRVRLEKVGIFADGVAVREVGRHTFPIVREAVDEVVRVTNDEICAAIKDIFEDTRSISEPAGALAVAGLKKLAANGAAPGRRWAAVVTGANMNFDRLRFVAERAELGEAREAVFAVTMPEKAGSFLAFSALLGHRVITEFNYRLHRRDQAHIFMGVSVSGRADAEDLADRLRANGYGALDLSGDEMAKLHVRHMVGGRAPDARSERLVRFEFPERPGALTRFLETLGGHWNISLFHYRNHGADFGRVLAGIEVPDPDMPAFQDFLNALGYPFVHETDNPAYRFFLGGE